MRHALPVLVPLLAALFLVPAATAVSLAFEPREGDLLHTVAPGIEAIPAAPGDPVPTRLRLTDDGAPVPNARITLHGQTVFTDRDGAARFSFYEREAQPHLMTVPVDSVELLRDGAYEAVEGSWPSLSVLWTDLLVRLSAPATVEAGASAPVQVETFWKRTGHPAADIPVTLFVDDETLRVVTGSDGVLAMVPVPSAGSVQVTAALAPGDRPNRVGADPAFLAFQAVDPGSSKDSDSNGSATGGPQDPSPPSGPDAAVDTSNGTDDPVVESGPRPQPVLDPDTLTHPITRPGDDPADLADPRDATAKSRDAPGSPLAVVVTALALITLRRRNP